MSTIADKLLESITCTCPKCSGNVQPDRNLVCPNCGESIYNEILDLVYDETSENILIFNEVDGSINKANVTKLAKGHKPIGDNALVVGISKEFFDLLIPDSHDRTSANSPYGKVLPQQPEDIQAAIQVLKQQAKPYAESSFKLKLENLSEYFDTSTDFANEFKQYEGMWEAF